MREPFQSILLGNDDLRDKKCLFVIPGPSVDCIGVAMIQCD